MDAAARLDGQRLHLCIAAPPIRRGRTINAKITDTQRHARLAALLRMAHEKLSSINAAPLAPDTHRDMQAPQDKWTRDHMRLAFLAPDIQKAILLGRTPSHINEELLLSPQLPLEWKAQREFLNIN